MSKNIKLQFSEDFSFKLTCPTTEEKNNKRYYRYIDCENNNIISEDSLSRTLSQIQNKVFAILTAYRQRDKDGKAISKEQNIFRNRKLRAILNKHKLGPHQLVGHWHEAPAGVDYKDANEKDLIDSIERSYLVVKPDQMSLKDFIVIINDCLTIDDETQDSAIINCEGTNDTTNKGYYLLIPNKYFNDIEFMKIGEKLTLNKISQAYSQHVKKVNIPFVFEGIEIPNGNSGAICFKEFGYRY